MIPAGEYSGCPGSISNTAIPRGARDLFLVLVPGFFKRQLPRTLPKVDFPDDLGPQIKTLNGFDSDASTKSAIFLFHSGGKTSSCRRALLGKSAAVQI
jgi:hypothetical protein